MRLRVVGIALVLVACSGGDVDDQAAAPSTTVSATSSTIATSSAPSTAPATSTTSLTSTTSDPTVCPDRAGLAELPLAEALTTIPELSTFAAASAAMGFPADGASPYTVLAPIDGAFAVVPDRDALLASPERTMGMLTLHMIPQRRSSAAELVDIAILQHVGVDLAFRLDDGVLRVNGARIVCPDIQTADGIIHLIDAVLTPPIDEETVGGTQLYQVDLATGATTPLGAIGGELGVVGLAYAPGDGSTVYGLTDATELIAFDPADPATVTVVPVTGVADGSSLIALASGNGAIYAISDASVLYTVDPATGAAAQVGDGINPPIVDPGVGFAIRPRGREANLSVATGENLPIDLSIGSVAVDPATEQPLADGAFVSADGATPPRIVALAWEYGPTDATTLYGIDSAAGTLVRVEPVEDGLAQTVGSLGIAVSDGASFDILDPGTGLLAVPG